jgi:glycosyltransferase involved in cell wall biosynthesis
MKEPLVAAIMLTKDRPAMAARAVRAFRAQTYGNKHLVVFDSGIIPFIDVDVRAQEVLVRCPAGSSIGALRNLACALAQSAEIIVHWDDDDWSHPNRIAEQVAHLQASGADVVGYDRLLFWMDLWETWVAPDHIGRRRRQEAWLYTNKRAKCGTSFCYWRKTWERRPFPDLPDPARGRQGEDWEWANGLEIATTSCFPVGKIQEYSPRLIASIHGGNTMPYDGVVEGANWERVPNWDTYCEEVMKL